MQRMPRPSWRRCINSAANMLRPCRFVILAGMPKPSVQGRQSVRLGSSQIRQVPNHQVTVHGLDTGIHAGMTAFLARQDLCLTARAGAWERAQTLPAKLQLAMQREAGASTAAFPSWSFTAIMLRPCRFVILAGMPKPSVQGWQALVYYIAQIKHLYNHQVTVHGLDTGIPAGMTAFLARQDLCITARAGAWERAQRANRLTGSLAAPAQRQAADGEQAQRGRLRHGCGHGGIKSAGQVGTGDRAKIGQRGGRRID